MTDYKKSLAEAISEVSGLAEADIIEGLEIPKNSDMGDYSYPCFRLAKTFKKAPKLIAEELVSKLEAMEDGRLSFISKIDALNGFLNFYVSDEQMALDTVGAVLREGKNFGSDNLGAGKLVVLDYSSVNIAKPFHIGHLRSTMIGEALKRIHKKLGYRTYAINYLGDYGTQFGKLIVAIRHWGDEEVIRKNPVPELLKLYVHFHEEADKDDALNDEARKAFAALESGDKEAERLWQFCVDASMEEFNRVYAKLDVEFDSFNGERFFSGRIDDAIKRLRDKGLLEKSQGAEVVNLDDEGLIPAIITKSDGSSIYITRDIASILYRREELGFDQNIYVVGSTQALHFKQLFAVIKKMGYDYWKDCHHVPFGQISITDGSLSTRGGKVIFLDDVLEAARATIKKVIDEKNPDLKDREEIEKIVGYGAVIFQELYTSREKDYVFDMESVTNFQGETGPYVQYTYARCCSVLRKAAEQKIEGFESENAPDAVDENAAAGLNAALLLDDATMAVIKQMRKFPDIIKLAARSYEPHHVARFAVDLAKAFNRFYYENPILTEDSALTRARLTLVKAARSALYSAMRIVCIGAPEEM